jgi:hypothetical protein
VNLPLVAGPAVVPLVLARPRRHHDVVPEGGAPEGAAHLQQIRQQSGVLTGKATDAPTEENR